MSVVHSRAPSRAVETYLSVLHELERDGAGSVTTSGLATHLGVTAGSASAMVRRLEERRLVAHEPYGGTSLTPAGVSAALRVLRRRRLVATFLVEEFGMPLERTRAEADALGHALSDELADLIAGRLGNPVRDPFGDPIPTEDLAIVEPPTVSLATLVPGDCATFVRLSGFDREMLGFLAGLGITPGESIEVVACEPFGGPLLVRCGPTRHSLGGGLVDAMRVEPALLEPSPRPTDGRSNREALRPDDLDTNGDRP